MSQTEKDKDQDMENVEANNNSDEKDDTQDGPDSELQNNSRRSRTEGMNPGSMIIPRPMCDCDQQEPIATFGRPHMTSKPMFIEDNDDAMKFRSRSLRDDEEVKQYSQNNFKEELKEEIDESGNIMIPSNRSIDRYNQLHSRERPEESNEIEVDDDHEEPAINPEIAEDSREQSFRQIIDTEEEEHDRQIDMAMEERMITRVNRNIQEGSIPEVQSSVGNASGAMPQLQSFQDAPLVRNGTMDLSDDELESALLDYSNNLEERIDAVKNEFINTVISSKRQILFSRRDFEKKVKKEYERIRVKNEMFKENKRKIVKLLDECSDIIDLDVGGTHQITTTRATLCRFRNSGLAAMFSGRFSLKYNGDRVFMDRDGEPFCKLVSYLRTGKLPIISDKQQEHLFKQEMEYWQIPFDTTEEEKTSENALIAKFDPSWCAPTLKLDDEHKLVKKNNPNHGIIFTSHPFDDEYTYQEFRVVITEPSRTKSHLFIGVVDKSKYRKEYLTSTFWRDSPSSFYWDVWSTKLIKTDENGSQSGIMNGYGCQCNTFETKLGISYDPVSKTLSFYKNGLLQGVAFKKVEKGLYPSLDIWFEAGSVEILSS